MTTKVTKFQPGETITKDGTERPVFIHTINGPDVEQPIILSVQIFNRKDLFYTKQFDEANALSIAKPNAEPVSKTYWVVWKKDNSVVLRYEYPNVNDDSIIAAKGVTLTEGEFDLHPKDEITENFSNIDNSAGDRTKHDTHHINGRLFAREKNLDLKVWNEIIVDECPVHPLDLIDVRFIDGEIVGIPGVARTFTWPGYGAIEKTHYKHYCDEDGIPYVHNDGSLNINVKYVATDIDGTVRCYHEKPTSRWASWSEADNDPLHQYAPYAPEHYANTKVAWFDSLRRVL